MQSLWFTERAYHDKPGLRPSCGRPDPAAWPEMLQAAVG